MPAPLSTSNGSTRAPLSDEERPLLDAAKHNVAYDRFSNGRKAGIVALVSWCGLVPLFASGSFFPTIPAIAEDLETTGAVISLAISLSVLATSLGALFAASYSSFYGRWPVYILALPLLVAGSFGVALAHDVPSLMTWRFVQAFGASPGLSVGAGVIGDIYPVDERGGTMGVFFAACLLGPALAPLCGGLVSQFSSWRVMQYILALAGFVGFLCMYALFPETSHPGTRGIDKYRAEVNPRKRFVFVNPVRPLGLLKSPNLLAITIAGLAILLTDYVFMTTIPFVFTSKYGITKQSHIGLCYLPIGFGNLIGAPLAGRLSDLFVRRSLRSTSSRKKWFPEARLQITLIGAAFFVPLSILGSGLLSEFGGSGNGWLAANVVCLFINGVGVDLVLSPCAAYGVDILHDRSAESMAANNGLRSLLMSLLIAGVIPLVDSVGIAATTAISAGFAWVAGFGLLWITIAYGDKMRAMVDMQYSESA